MDNKSINKNTFGGNTFGSITNNAVGYQTPEQFQKKSITSSSQTDVLPDMKSNFENSKREMRAAGIPVNPITGDYTQAQIDDWNKNKYTSKGLERDAKQGVKMGTSAAQLQKAQETVNNPQNLPYNSVQGTENSLDSSITSNNEKQKKEAEDYYKGKQTQEEVNDLSAAKFDENNPEDEATAKEAAESVITNGGKGEPSGDNANKTLEDNGLGKKDEDGRFKPLMGKSEWAMADKSGKLSMIMTGISVIASALSGGNIIPINFNKISGVDNQYNAYLKVIDDYNNSVINPAASTVKGAEAFNEKNKLIADFTKDNPGDAELAAKAMNELTAEQQMSLANAQKETIAAYASGDVERIKAQEQANANLIGDTIQRLKDENFSDADITKYADIMFAHLAAGTPEQQRARTIHDYVSLAPSASAKVGPDGIDASIKNNARPY